MPFPALTRLPEKRGFSAGITVPPVLDTVFFVLFVSFVVKNGVSTTKDTKSTKNREEKYGIIYATWYKILTPGETRVCHGAANRDSTVSATFRERARFCSSWAASMASRLLKEPSSTERTVMMTRMSPFST